MISQPSAFLFLLLFFHFHFIDREKKGPLAISHCQLLFSLRQAIALLASDARIALAIGCH